METFILRISTENDAFQAPGNMNLEIALNLRMVAQILEQREAGDVPAMILKDSNGNRAGFACLGNPGEVWNFGTDAGDLPGLND